MFLISPEVVAPVIHPYYTKFRNYKLLGYMPATEFLGAEISTDHGYVIPVFLGHDPGAWFDWECGECSGDWIIFFKGCDDSSYGSRFISEYEALEWLKKLQISDFNQFVDGRNPYKLCYFN
jgi:hypothetical protein